MAFYQERSVGTYMNAAEGLASEAEAALRKARKYTDDAASGKPSAPVSGTKRRQPASSYKQKCPDCGSFDHVYQECVYWLNPYLIRTPRLSMLNPPWGSDISISIGGGISKCATWILPCARTIEMRVCSESDCAKRIFLCIRVNPLVESGLCLEVESPLRTVAVIPRSEQTRSRISHLTNAIAALVSRTRNPAVRNSTIGVERQRALTIADMTMPKIGIATRTTARTGNRISTAEPSATQGVVAETLRRIVAATPERKWTITRSARGIHGTRRTVKTQEKSDATSLLTQRGIDQATVSVLKLMMIIPMHARFSMLRRRLMKLTGQTIDCYLLQFLTLRVTLAYLAYMSMSCLTQERLVDGLYQ